MLKKFYLVSEKEQDLKNQRKEFFETRKNLKHDLEIVINMRNDEEKKIHELRQELKKHNNLHKRNKELNTKKNRKLLKKEVMLIKAEKELMNGRDNLSKLKKHYLSELNKLKKREHGFKNYEKSISKLKEYVKQKI